MHSATKQNECSPEIKITFIEGLEPVVKKELQSFVNPKKISFESGSFYLEYFKDFSKLLLLKSALRAYLVARSEKFNPSYVSRHKAVLGNLIEEVLLNNKNSFSTFNISAAGTDSPEIKDTANYIKNTFKLEEDDEADLKIHIAKKEYVWEIGVQISPRPLSVREYKINDMAGAMNPTIAYALNSLCQAETRKSYLNMFCGSGTLLIEAAEVSTNLERISGFDSDKKAITLAIQNIKKAGFIRKIQIEMRDVFDEPAAVEKFDIITADLPFGMKISKDADLDLLYSAFFSYAAKVIRPNGVLGFYTPKTDIVEQTMRKFPFEITHVLPLKLVTSVNSHLRPSLYVCKLR